MGYKILGDQKVSVHLTITVQSSGAQRLLYHSVLKSETEASPTWSEWAITEFWNLPCITNYTKIKTHLRRGFKIWLQEVQPNDGGGGDKQQTNSCGGRRNFVNQPKHEIFQNYSQNSLLISHKHTSLPLNYFDQPVNDAPENNGCLFSKSYIHINTQRGQNAWPFIARFAVPNATTTLWRVKYTRSFTFHPSTPTFLTHACFELVV